MLPPGLPPKGCMQMDFVSDKPKILMATVYVKSRSGRSILHEGRDALNDHRPYLPSSEIMDKVAAELQQFGFKIEGKGVTLSISGPPELFEQCCGVQISLEEKTIYLPGEEKPGTKFIFKSSQPVMHIQKLHDFIDGIVVSTPGIPLKSHGLLK